jgi:hypothetical protein
MPHTKGPKGHEQGKGTMTVQEAGRKGGEEVQRQRDLRDSKQVRGHAYDKPGPPEGTAFGIAAITQALSGLDFPVTRQQLLERAGNQTIEYRKGHPVRLRDIIQRLEPDEYPSMANVVEACSAAIHEHAPA